MSRSYKHTPNCKSGDDNSYKKIYNRKIRRNHSTDDIDLRPSSYKKLNESYNIVDYNSNCSFEEYLAFRKSYGFDEDLTIEESREEWERFYKRK